MTDDEWTIELAFGGAHAWDPEGTYQVYRSDDIFGGGGRVLVSRIGTATQDGSMLEVGYETLSPTALRDVIVEGRLAVRLRRLSDGTVTGEWIRPAAAVSTAPPVPPPAMAAPIVSAPAVPRAAPAKRAAPTHLPDVKVCAECASFRPYVRISERFTQELATAAAAAEVAKALNDLVSQEERGKGEEARLLADLYRRGATRWVTRPWFFSYCAAHERDPEEPTVFIAQIRNADRRCRPVRRSDGTRFTATPTDFAYADPEPHACATCAHRVRAVGPSADAKDVRDVVAAAIQADSLGAIYGIRGATSAAGGFAQTTQSNAAAARAREVAEAYARRSSASHAAAEPRYLDHCGLRSEPAAHRYRVCAVENANDRCADWAPPSAPVR